MNDIYKLNYYLKIRKSIIHEYMSYYFCILYKSSVFCNTIAIVIGPTPPGTG